MTDYLLYRLPGEGIVEQSGSFERHPDGSVPQGFVITDFLHQDVYRFVADTQLVIPAQLHVHPGIPVVISRRDYQIESQALLHAFGVFGVQKAVYSRVKATPFSISKARELFGSLERTYPNAFVYLASSRHFGTWIGATPELLMEGGGGTMKTIALAGTHRHDDGTVWSEKEYDEHRYVVEAVEETLRRNGITEMEKEGPAIVTAGPVDHLRTDFTANAPGTAFWKVAMDLHPTPAVCGTPRMAALDLLLSREMHERKLYAGVVGLNNDTQTHLFVNLRCAQLGEDQAYLYVGGGYTRESIPDLEWEESENKARTLLNCIEKL